MMSYFQETDSRMVFPVPYEQTYSFPIVPRDETLGGRPYVCGGPLLEEPYLIEMAWATVRQSRNRQAAQEARNLLLIIQDTIASFRKLGFNIGYLPPLRAFNVDDGSVLIEWIFGDFRIGFTFEQNPEESGWYLVSNRSLGEISASGYTSGLDVKTPVLWLVNFVLSNT